MDDFHFPPMTADDGTFIYSEYELREFLEKHGIDLNEIKKYYQEEAEQEIEYIKNHTDNWELIADGYHTELVNLYNLLDELADSLEEGRHQKAYYAEEVRHIMRHGFSI